MEELRDTLTYFNSDLYLVPRAKEGEFRKKYETFIEKLGKYELASKKLEMVLANDTAGLRQLKNSLDCYMKPQALKDYIKARLKLQMISGHVV